MPQKSQRRRESQRWRDDPSGKQNAPVHSKRVRAASLVIKLEKGRAVNDDDLWESLGDADRNRANRMTAESIQVMAAGLAHIFRGDVDSANEVFAQLSHRPVDQTMNAHAFAVAVVEYCARKLDQDPIQLLEEMAGRAALLRESLDDEEEL